MSEGYIYALQNESLKGILKVGNTTRSIPERVSELSHSPSIPTLFKCVYWAKVRYAANYEAHVHVRLQSRKVGKEFFRLTAEEAQIIISQVVGDNLIHDKLHKPEDVKFPDPRTDTYMKLATAKIDRMSLSTEEDYVYQIKKAARKISELRDWYQNPQNLCKEASLWQVVHDELNRIKSETWPSQFEKGESKENELKTKLANSIDDLIFQISRSANGINGLVRKLEDLISKAKWEFPNEDWNYHSAVLRKYETIHQLIFQISSSANKDRINDLEQKLEDLISKAKEEFPNEDWYYALKVLKIRQKIHHLKKEIRTAASKDTKIRLERQLGFLISEAKMEFPNEKW